MELLEKEISAINLASAAAGAYEKYTLDVDRQLAESRAVAAARGSQPDCRCDYARESSRLVSGRFLAKPR